MRVMIPVSIGELFDKISILEIKRDRIPSEAQLAHIRDELDQLVAVRDQNFAGRTRLQELGSELKAINERLWEIEDKIRLCERERRFDEEFVQLARAVYHHNDERAAVKRKINETTGSAIIEEKSYWAY